MTNLAIVECWRHSSWLVLHSIDRAHVSHEATKIDTNPKAPKNNKKSSLILLNAQYYVDLLIVNSQLSISKKSSLDC